MKRGRVLGSLAQDMSIRFGGITLKTYYIGLVVKKGEKDRQRKNKEGCEWNIKIKITWHECHSQYLHNKASILSWSNGINHRMVIIKKKTIKEDKNNKKHFINK